MKKDYGGVIWTNHALQRLKERKISQGDAWVTWKKPDQSRYAESKGAWIYYRTFPTSLRQGRTGKLRGTSGNQRIEVVAKKNEEGKWIILSVWSRQVFGKQKPKKAGFFEKILSSILKRKK